MSIDLQTRKDPERTKIRDELRAFPADSAQDGGLSAGKYRAITGAGSATASRDLADLLEKGALTRTGELKGTRYWLPFPGN